MNTIFKRLLWGFVLVAFGYMAYVETNEILRLVAVAVAFVILLGLILTTKERYR